MTSSRDYKTGRYWIARSDLVYYQYIKMIIRCIGQDANSLIDVGTGNSPYLEWFDWIDEKVSVDIRVPYESKTVKGIQGNILDMSFNHKFNICTCFQVIEHIAEPIPFAQRLMELGELLLVSVPYEWPRGSASGHVNDPVTYEKLFTWFGREANWSLVVQEPFAGVIGRRLFALYDIGNPERKFGWANWRNRRPIKV